MRPRDTEAAAHEAQMSAYRRMTSDTRVRIAFEMCEAMRQITLEGIRARHPEYDDHRAQRALFRILLGDELMGRAWPGEELVAP